MDADRNAWVLAPSGLSCRAVLYKVRPNATGRYVGAGPTFGCVRGIDIALDSSLLVTAQEGLFRVSAVDGGREILLPTPDAARFYGVLSLPGRVGPLDSDGAGVASELDDCPAQPNPPRNATPTATDWETTATHGGLHGFFLCAQADWRADEPTRSFPGDCWVTRRRFVRWGCAAR